MTHLQEQFEAFHRDNPSVWAEFERIALQLIKLGREHYSADAIFHVIRYHRAIETSGAGEVDGRELKLNDHYTAFYSRMFRQAHPEHSEFFYTRRASHDRPIAGAAPCHNRAVNA